MKEIKLSRWGKNRGKYVALVDDDIFEYLNQWNWFVMPSGETLLYAMRYDYTGGKKKGVFMHRLIMSTPDNQEVDHVFHNGLDNRKFIEVDGELKCNLRNCTHKQNQMNQSSHGDSKYLGVYIKRRGKLYEHIIASIRVNNKFTYLGIFKTEEDAAKAYNKAAKKYFGEYANLNIIEK